MPEKIDPIAENEKAEREWYHRWPNKETWVPTRTLLYSLYSKEKDQSRTAFRRIYFLLWCEQRRHWNLRYFTTDKMKDAIDTNRAESAITRVKYISKRRSNSACATVSRFDSSVLENHWEPFRLLYTTAFPFDST